VLFACVFAESQTYETFEKDPVKYSQYEKAVYHALMDRFPPAAASNPPTTAVLMVVGAGRGPLVRASLRAAAEAKRAVRVYAIEKNPNAVVTYVLTTHRLLSCASTSHPSNDRVMCGVAGCVRTNRMCGATP
jgi:hypothetical protein